MPTVSVVIATFNRAQYVKEAIQSVLDQTYQDFEIVLVDDGSTDNTCEVVDKFDNSKIRYIFQKNSGVCIAYNTGIRNSRGRLIAFLDDDDLWLPRKLELQIKASESSPQAGVIYSDIFNFGNSDPSIPETHFQPLKWPPPRGKVLDKLIERCFPQTSTLLIKREVFDQIGLFDENLPNCQDYDMLIRIATKFDFEVVTLPLAKYRIHPTQISKNSESVLSCHIYFLNKAIRSSLIDKTSLHKLHTKISDYYFRYGIVLIRKRKFAKGFRELTESIKSNPSSLITTFFPRAVIRIIDYPFTYLNARVRSALAGVR